MKPRMTILMTIGLIALLPTPSDAARIGLSAGPSYSRIHYSDPIDFWDPGSDWGFSAGVSLELGLSDHVAFAPEVRFVRLQNRVDMNAESLGGFFNVRMDYVAVPLSVRLAPASGGVFIEAGPEIGLLLEANILDNVTFDFFGPVTTEEFEQFKRDDDITDSLESVNVSVALGGGVDFKRWSVPVALRLRYVYGLTDVRKDATVTSWATRELSLTATYWFGL